MLEYQMLGSWTARREACVRDMSVIMRVVDIITCCKSLAPHHTMNPLSSKHRCGYLLAAILTQLISQCTHKSVTVAVIADSIHMPITLRRVSKAQAQTITPVFQASLPRGTMQRHAPTIRELPNATAGGEQLSFAWRRH